MNADRTVRRSEWTGGGIRTVGDVDILPASRHRHRIPGVWDPDNGPWAGRVCGTCWRANYPISLDHLLAEEASA